MKDYFLLLVSLFLWLPIPFLQKTIQKERLQSGAAKKELLYTHKFMLTLGQEALLSDLFWIQTLRYTYRHLEDKDFYYLYSLFDRITDLDPYFLKAYLYGSAFLTSLAGKNQYAILLLLKGWRFTRHWRIAWELGSVFQIYLKDIPSALYWYEIAVRDPESPPLCRKILVALKTKDLKDPLVELEMSAKLALQRYLQAKQKQPKGLLTIARKKEAREALKALLKALEKVPHHPRKKRYRTLWKELEKD